MLKQDIRDTRIYKEAEALLNLIVRPGSGLISDAADLNVSPDGRRIVFAATLADCLEGTLPTQICQLDLVSADLRILTFERCADHLPKHSPDGTQVAFLSDRHKPGDFQLWLLDLSSGASRAAPRVDGWIEYLHWSPDGKRVLLGVAGYGADVAGAQGGITSAQVDGSAPSWMPSVRTGEEEYRWRRVWVLDLASDSLRRVSPMGINIWEAVWCGNGTIAALTSPGPGEELWYGARLNLVDLQTGRMREIFTAQDQMGCIACSPSGKRVTIVEALCSDRLVIAGDLRVIDTSSGTVHRVDTRGVDISHVEWRSERALLVAGHRRSDCVVGVYDSQSDHFAETWASQDVGAGGRFITVAGLNETGDCALVGESFVRGPEVGVIRNGTYAAVKSFDIGYTQQARVIAAVTPLSWSAPDGLMIQGWLLRPDHKAPHPLVMYVHGGPVWHWRPSCLFRMMPAVLLLLKRGYAVFFPNPRGSVGRGQQFVRHVLGDMGGADAQDCLSGLDHLVELGFADSQRLGVTGGSYGGFMSCWLITHDPRFKAAVSVAPMINYVSQHFLSNIPAFDSLFLEDRYTHPGGEYFERSPLMHAHKTKTPTLNICGALDCSAPPSEAVQFHNALLENGVKSALVTYPEEGHGVRKFPAVIDCAARVTAWFEEHM